MTKEEIAKAFDEAVAKKRRESCPFNKDNHERSKAGAYFDDCANWLKEEFIEMYLALDYFKQWELDAKQKDGIATTALSKANKKIGVGGES